MAKLQVFWISDAYSRESVHRNGPNMTMEASYLGHLERRDGEWFFHEKGVEKPHGPFANPGAAKRETLRILDAEYVG